MDNKTLYIFFFVVILCMLVSHLNCIKTIEHFYDTKNQENKIQDNINEINIVRDNLSSKYINKNKNKKVEYISLLKDKLDSIRKEDESSINNHIEIKTDEIKKLKNLIYYLNNSIKENDINKIETNSIKSLKNGLKIAVENVNNKNNYLIHLNNKCASINSIGNFDLNECNKMDSKQYFQIKNIYNPEVYKDNLEKGIYNPFNGNNLEYPFNIIKSLNNYNCLDNDNDTIRVLPCQMKKTQRWTKFNDKVVCSK